MKAYELEATIVALENAIQHAKAAQMDIHFISELEHSRATAEVNRDFNALQERINK